MAKPINTHPNYRSAGYELLEEAFNHENRNVPTNFVTWPIFLKQYWTRDDGTDLSQCLTLPQGIDGDGRYINTNPGHDDKETPWKTNLISDAQLIEYIANLPEDRQKQISQVEFEGGSELNGHIPWTVPEGELAENEEEPSPSNTWIQQLDMDLVMLRITYTNINDWGFNKLMKAPFWKRGYLQFLDLDHNIFLDDEFDDTFVSPTTPQVEGETPSLDPALYPYYENLKFLSLRCCRLGEIGLTKLVQSPLVKNLVHLDLDCTFWTNTEEDTHNFFTTCNFTCLRILSVNNMNLMDQAFQDLMGWVGHTLEYLYAQGNSPLTLKREIWDAAKTKNAERTGAQECFRNLKVIDFGVLTQADSKLLETILEFCQTQNLKELRVMSTYNITGVDIFSAAGKTWDRLELLEIGRSHEKQVHQGMITKPIALYDVFYNSKAGKIGEREVTIGERAKCVTWAYENLDLGKPTGQKITVSKQDEEGKEAKQEVDELLYASNHLAYLVWSKYYIHQRKEQAQKIVTGLNSNLGIGAINLKDLFSPAFFAPPIFSLTTQYDLEFEQFANPAW